MSSPIIKLSSITNLHDARFGAGMGSVLDIMIGFSLNPNNQNYVSEQDFVQISGWIAGCKIVAELEGNTISEEAQKILSNKDYKIDFVQISQLAIFSELKSKNYTFPIIYSTSVKEIENITKENFEIDYFLLESKESNQEHLSEKEFQILQKLSKEFSIILGFGITNENVIDLLSQTELKGIAFKGQTETEVGMGGYTDFDEISDVLEKVEEL